MEECLQTELTITMHVRRDEAQPRDLYNNTSVSVANHVYYCTSVTRPNDPNCPKLYRQNLISLRFAYFCISYVRMKLLLYV